ncbi:MAG: hypothetical protein M1834_002193 [Cirrosporium novae-zelandiae]|nr:MAG: hypothetical protein M1834_002193 [Cirrosporium novae-zelandiae]
MSESAPPRPHLPSLPESAFDSVKHKLTFYNHSQDTVPQNLPPTVDNKGLVRQKRRRTSPQDHAILEAEYRKNPKPDKAARLEIVDRVALGEKEVQIWFQNRRQNDRRKSRPLLPHELTAYYQPPMGMQPSTIYQGGIYHPHLNQPGATSSNSVDGQKAPIGSSVSKLQETPRGNGNDKCSSQRFNHEQLSQSTVLSSSTPENRISITPDNGLNRFLPLSQGRATEVGYLSNRRSAAAALQRASSFTQTPLFHSSPLPYPHKNSTSHIKLSMSLEGKAKVITSDDSSSPSPPRTLPPLLSFGSMPTPRPFNSLQRSRSIASPSELSRQQSQLSSPQSPWLHRTPSSQNWDYYNDNDNDARDALSAQNSSSQPGSALSAIEIIRASSAHKKILTPNPKKRNAQPLIRPDVSAKRQKPSPPSEIPTPSRDLSSTQRLQSPTVAHTAKKSKISRCSSTVSIYRSPSAGDSDKENWEPGTQYHPRRQHPNPNPNPNTQSRRTVFKENSYIPSHSNSIGAYLSELQNSNNIKTRHVNQQNENLQGGGRSERDQEEEEVERFMAGGRNRDKGDDDLGAIQGLLSLSQGAWR